VNPDDPRRILAQEVAKEVVATLKAGTRWFSRDGAGPGAEQDKVSDQHDDLQPPSGESEKP
jgi:hypothetical protein